MRLVRQGVLPKPIKAQTISEPKHIVDQSTLASPPLSPSSRVHFLRGIVIFGRAIYGEGWADAELHARDTRDAPDASKIMSLGQTPEPAVPENPDPGEAEHEFAARLLKATDNHSEWFAKDEKRKAMWAESLKATQERWQQNWNAVSRVDAAYRRLLQAIMDEEIPAFWRTDMRGAQLALVRGEFFADSGLRWTLRRFGTVRYNDKTHHVFLDRDGLDRSIAMLPGATIKASNSDLAACSPHLRFAVAFTSRWGRDVVNGSRDWLEAQIIEDWNKANPDDPMGATMATRVGYVIRPSDPKAAARGGKRPSANRTG